MIYIITATINKMSRSILFASTSKIKIQDKFNELQEISAIKREISNNISKLIKEFLDKDDNRDKLYNDNTIDSKIDEIREAYLIAHLNNYHMTRDVNADSSYYQYGDGTCYLDIKIEEIEEL